MNGNFEFASLALQAVCPNNMILANAKGQPAHPYGQDPQNDLGTARPG